MGLRATNNGIQEEQEPLSQSPVKGVKRPKTMSRREMTREKRRRERAGEVIEILDYERPMNRSECVNGPRPCLYVSCKYSI